MRLSFILILSLVIGGCASRSASHSMVPAKPVYEEVSSTALVFDPPVAYGLPRMDFPRDVRQPAAFVGFDDLSATYFYTRTDDRLNLSNDGWSYRRAVSEKVGVSYR